MPVTIGGSGPITGVTSINTTVSDTELGYLDGLTQPLTTSLANKLNGSGAATASVSTQQTTTSTTYTDLATSGPAVTLTTGTKALVIVTSDIDAANNISGWASLAVSGATTLSADDSWAIRATGQTGGGAAQGSTVSLITGLTAGSNTFTMKYRASSATTTYFAKRSIVVIDMGS